jgi:hypothetical protein
VAHVIDMIRTGPSHARVDSVGLGTPQDLAPCQGFATR